MRLPASVELGNRITAQEAAERYELPNGYKTLCRAIDAGIVRGERVDVGRRCIHLVDPAELEEDLASLPPVCLLRQEARACPERRLLRPARPGARDEGDEAEC